MIKALSKLGRDCRATTAVEFAVVGPTFILLVLGIAETSRMTLYKQGLQHAAFEAARCMMTGGLAAGEGCKTSTEVTNFAVDRARAAGVNTLNASGVQVINNGASCNGRTDFSGVRLTAAFNGVATGFLPATLSQISASACFPNAPPPTTPPV